MSKQNEQEDQTRTLKIGFVFSQTTGSATTSFENSDSLANTGVARRRP